MSSVTSDAVMRWKDKYFAALEELDQKEKQWASIEESLYRSMSRLALTAYGIDIAVDKHLDLLRNAIRDRHGYEYLDKLIADVHEAVSCAEDDPARPRATPPLNQVLLHMLDHLSFPQESQQQVERLKARLDQVIDVDELPELFEDITSIVTDMRKTMQRERAEMEGFLRELTSRLQDLDCYLQKSDAKRTALVHEGRTLQEFVFSEVKGIQSDVDDALDLEQLKCAVNERIEAIESHMEVYIRSEDERIRGADEETQRLTERLRAVEAETTRLQEKLRAKHIQALKDGLTGLYNRMAYDERVVQEHARWKRYGTPLSLLLWDIDRFKVINDTYGHQAGDKVLQSVARLLESLVRETDFVARYGGEEFVILMPETPGATAHKVAEKLRSSFEETNFHYRDTLVKVSASCGTASFSRSDTPECVLRRADEALYRAKQAGRNQCRMESFDESPTMGENA